MPLFTAKGDGDDATDHSGRYLPAAGGRHGDGEPGGVPADRGEPHRCGGLSGAGGQVFSQVGGAPEFLDRFGEALAAGDFNGDGFADLAVGASGEDVGGVFDAGAVSVLYGSADGLTTAGGRLFTQLGSAPEEQDWFGWAVAAGDFNQDGFTDLAAAAPMEDVGTASNAGAVSVVPGSGAGLTSTGGRLFTQASPGVPGIPETFDLFGGLEVVF